MNIHEFIRNLSKFFLSLKKLLVFRIGVYQLIKKRTFSAGNQSVLQGIGLFAVIFRKSAKFVDLLLYSEKSVEV